MLEEVYWAGVSGSEPLWEWGTREVTEEQLGRDAARMEVSVPMGALELGQAPECSGGRRWAGLLYPLIVLSQGRSTTDGHLQEGI